MGRGGWTSISQPVLAWHLVRLAHLLRTVGLTVEYFWVHSHREVGIHWLIGGNSRADLLCHLTKRLGFSWKREGRVLLKDWSPTEGALPLPLVAEREERKFEAWRKDSWEESLFELTAERPQRLPP